MLFMIQSKTNKQLICCCFGLENAVPIHPTFEPYPLNTNAERWWDGHSSSHLPVLKYTDVDHCGLMCLNYLHETRRSSWTWSVTNVKTILVETRKPFSCRALSEGIVLIHVSGRLRCFRPSIELKENNMLEMFQFLHLELHFLASPDSLIIFKWQNFNM